MKQAQNLIEVSLILCLVVTFSLVTWAIINKQQLKLVNLSKIKVETLGKASNVITLPDDDGVDDPAQSPETLGGNAH